MGDRMSKVIEAIVAAKEHAQLQKAVEGPAVIIITEKVFDALVDVMDEAHWAVQNVRYVSDFVSLRKALDAAAEAITS